MPLLHEAVHAVEHGLVGCNRAPWRILRQNRGVRPSHLPQDVSAARRLLLNLSMLRTRFLVRWRRQFLVRHLKWKWILLWLLTVNCLLGMKTMSLGKYNKSFVVWVKAFAYIMKTVAVGPPVPYSQVYNFVSRNGSWLSLLNSIQINQATRCNSFTSLLLDVYVWLNMFRASPRPSSGNYAALGASGFAVGEKCLECCWSWSARPRPTTLQPPLSNGKNRGS